jgi:hypothetical protein
MNHGTYWILPPTAALDIVALKCLIRKEEALGGEKI